MDRSRTLCVRPVYGVVKGAGAVVYSRDVTSTKTLKYKYKYPSFNYKYKYLVSIASTDKVHERRCKQKLWNRQSCVVHINASHRYSLFYWNATTDRLAPKTVIVNISQWQSVLQIDQSELLHLRSRGQSNLTKSASRGAHSPFRGHPRGSKVVPLNSWGRVSY